MSWTKSSHSVVQSVEPAHAKQGTALTTGYMEGHPSATITVHATNKTGK